MSVSASFAPNEPEALIQAERAIFVEVAFEAIGYGFTLCLYLMTVNNLLKKDGFKSSWKLITFLSMQQIAVFLGVAGNINFAQLAFVDNRNIPGGPLAYQQQFSNRPFALAALSGFTISTWLQDVLLTGMRADLLADPGRIPAPVIFFSLSVGLNVILTSLIVGRLIAYRRKLNRTLGGRQGQPYVTIMAIIIESAALYTCVGIVQVVSLETNTPVSLAIEGLYGIMTALAPHLIAFRVSQGRAFTRESSSRSTVNFVPRSGPTSRITESATAYGSTISKDDILLSQRGESTTVLGQIRVEKYTTSDRSDDVV
ncbi:hypothetical protein Clacol_003144 [Clathrus columnatus]|uniref:Uncharacterized protein n=1 Tax=Clathrus columnatus TaxID=1419009 RepID=A0AAV5A2P4_9AGAM|nr:hypothetical protein Clacol_003144 [Clathrus columnatus]